MDLELRSEILVHGKVSNGIDFAFSTRRPALVTTCGKSITVQNVSNDAISARIRSIRNVERIVYVGGAAAFLVFLDDGSIASYLERPTGLELVSDEKTDRGPRSIVHVASSVTGLLAAFTKEDSPSAWCVSLKEDGQIRELFKLRSDIEGDQDNVNTIDGVFARVRGKVGTKPIVALAIHPNRPLMAAAYSNGIVRVWDAYKKEQKSHLDAQLLIGEKITGMALHPTSDNLVLCTSQGRLISFRVQHTMFRRGDDPGLAVSKMRERRRSFLRVCFLGVSPAYIVVLTRTRRLLFRFVNSEGVIVHSARHLHPTRPLPVTLVSDPHQQLIGSRKVQAALDVKDSNVTMKYDSLFGFLAIAFEKCGNVFVYQRRLDRLPYVARSISCGIDSAFSNRSALDKPLLVARDAVFVQSGWLFSYSLGKEVVTRLCKLPNGDFRSIRIARDSAGTAVAALVFMYIDEVSDSLADRADASTFARYVLCTKRNESVEWNVSEPADGRSGCFLNREGDHDQILIISNTGHSGSIFSFSSKKKQGAISRGVCRLKLGTDRCDTVFRSPFCSWMSVIYFDVLKKRIAISANAFRKCSARISPEMRLNIAESEDGYLMDNDAYLKLRSKEIALDVRWQCRTGHREGVRWYGAILTNLGVYFVQDVLAPLSKLDFVTIERTIVNFGLPTMLWLGPSVAILFGNTLYSVSMDGRADLIAGLSQGENASALLAMLPDRVVYAKPSGFHRAQNVAVASKPLSSMSMLIRSALCTPWSEGGGAVVDEISELLQSSDATQGSEELVEALIRNRLAPIAYLVCAYIVPPLKRASFLARIGDIRGALAVTEVEYANLPNAESFHFGTELHRLTQRIMNMAIVSGDFAVSKRCSALLGRRGTFEAFVESEGGYPALKIIMEYAGNTGNQQIANLLRPLLERSAESCIATDSSRFPSAQEIRNARSAVESMDMQNVPLGTKDHVKIAIRDVETTKMDSQTGHSQLDSVGELIILDPQSINGSLDRLQVLSNQPIVELMSGDDNNVSSVHNEFVEEPPTTFEKTPRENVLGSTAVVNNGNLVGGIPRPTNVSYNAPSTNEENTGPPLSVTNENDSSANTVVRMLGRGMAHVDNGKYEDALKMMERGIDALAQSLNGLGQRNVIDNETRGLLGRLVGYRMAMKLWLAMEQIRSSPHANTIGGQVTIAQLATAMGFAYGFHPRHAIGALNLACDANMSIGNYGTAARCLVQIRSLANKGDVTEAVKQTLKAKYAKCQSCGLQDHHSPFSWNLCFESLRLIGDSERGHFCSICPARFSTAVGLCAKDQCTCCRVGIVDVR